MTPPPILSAYLGRHFISGIATMMGILLGLVFLIDLAELFRRSWGRENVSFLIVIQMAVLRAPFMVQKILPFAALFGGMLAFVRLTRTNQLIVARAAGLSVWQFLFPTIAIALLAGLFVVTLFNPLASDHDVSLRGPWNPNTCEGSPACSRSRGQAFGCGRPMKPVSP